ncbi:MAG: GNAT family N-acetyltransferase [Patescibacteria group bacterium]
MSHISIQLASSEDAQPIRLVQHDTWIKTYPNEQLGITLQAIQKRVSKNFSPESIKKMEETIADVDKRTWVAKDDLKVIGYCTVAKNKDINHLEAIYIFPEYHGINVGNMLLEPALKWLGNEKDIIVEVASYNHRAIRFYEKNNFKKNGVTGESKGIPTVNLVKAKHANNHFAKKD